MSAKIYTGNVQPNHKEFKIWVNDEGLIKTWDGQKWIECSGGGSSDDKIIYYELHDGYTVWDVREYFDYFASMKSLIFGKYCFGRWVDTDKDHWSGEYPVKAVAFLPIDVDFDEDGESIHAHFDDFESAIDAVREIGWDVPDGPIIKRRITAEEYWDTATPKPTFTLKSNNTDYQKTFDVREGMTWEQWVESDYNTDGLEKATYFSDKTNVYFHIPNGNGPHMVTDTQGIQPTWSDTIDADMYYFGQMPI